MHPDVETVAGLGLGRYRDEPYLDDGGRAALAPRAARTSRDAGVLRPVARRRSRPTAASACSTARSAAP